MYDIKDLNIWKKEEPRTKNRKGLRDVDISELNLSVRSYNCLRRVNCNTVGDILDLMDEEGNGLRKIRNLGSRSEAEIKETVSALEEEYACRPQPAADRIIRRLVKPAKISMSRTVDEFSLSGRALTNLHAAGIHYVQDLYNEDNRQEPGWFAVRELFEQILAH